jgi:4-carboxymuconolactone decarboxylase
MPITETAQRNHEQLFFGHAFTPKVTDPELIEIFDNWAFGEVVEAADMDVRLRLMVQLAALIASMRLASTASCWTAHWTSA